MALAIMGGLIAATILTMTFLPALYALAFGIPEASAVNPPRLSAALSGMRNAGVNTPLLQKQ